MSLSTILKEIEVNRANAEMDVALGSPETYGGRMGLKRAGVEAISRLKSQYHDELLKSAAFIVVTGPARDTFSELSSGPTFGCFSVDPEELFKDLTSRIDSSLFGREGVKHLFNIATNLLQDKATELDIQSYNMVQFSDRYNSAVNSAEDFVPLIRNAVVDQMGSEIVGLNAIKLIVDRAIKNNHTSAVTPIILNTPDENFALELQKNLKSHVDRNGERRGLTSKVFLVVAGKASKSLNGIKDAVFVKNVSEESVGEALTSINNKI